MPYKDPQKKKEHDIQYHIKNKAKINAKSKKWFNEHREYHSKYMKDYYMRTADKRSTLEYKARVNANQKHCRANNRRKCIDYYSKGKFECACCHEKIYDFLTIEHVNGDGNIHRKQMKWVDGTYIYLWLIRNKFPDGYIVLCMNCNWGTRFGNPCPHSQLITAEMKGK